MKKALNIREMTDQELAKASADKAKEQFSLKLQKATGQLVNTAQLRAIRRDIAKINTELSSRAKKA